LLLSLALVCWGRQNWTFYAPAVQQPANQVPRRTVTGTVTNAVSGEPVRRALVRLIAPGRNMSALTGADGRFEIEDVPEGTVNLVAQKPGFFDSGSMNAGQWRQPDVGFKITANNDDFRLKLFPAAKIIGRITDQDGEGIEEVSVEILSEQINNGRKQWQPRNMSSTDDDGSYRIDDLLPGRYIAFATGHIVPGSNWNAQQQVSAPAYYPDARDLASAQPIEIEAGEEFRADFHLRTEPGSLVTGRITGIPTGSRVNFMLQNSTRQNIWPQGISFDQKRGQFALKAIPSGTWNVVAFANDQGNQYEARQEITASGADISNVVMALQPKAWIPVKVNHAANQPQPTVEHWPRNAGVNATLIAADTFNDGYGMQQDSEARGSVFANVAEGRYKLVVQSFGNECVETAWYGNVDLLRDYLVVSSGGEVQPITINLTSNCATLSAKVQQEEGQRQALLLVVPSSGFAEPRVVPIAMSGAATATFRGMPATLSPGSYQVYAFSSLVGLEYANPEVLRDYPSQSVDLNAGQKMELTVKLSDPKAN